MVQPSLFDSARLESVPFSGSRPETRETSKQAAIQALTKADSMRLVVWACICKAGDAGRTDAEIQEALSLDGNTERPRRRELEQAGLIKPAGTRRTASGRAAVVWVAA